MNTGSNEIADAATATETLRLELEHSRRIVGQVDDPTRHHWSTVVNSHYDSSPVAQVRNPYPATKR